MQQTGSHGRDISSKRQTFNEMEYDERYTVFHLNAPSKSRSVKVGIYRSAVIPRPELEVEMQLVDEDRWAVTVEGNLKGLFYTFDVGKGECPGTFAKAVGVNGRRAAILDLRETNPVGWKDDVRPPLASPSDLVVYELHHRDFSVHPSRKSRFSGRFLALTEPNNIHYLKTLGINAVQLLPSFDFATVDEARPDLQQYNWGYDPLNYNVPEGSYATDAIRPEVRIREFKQMVQALHRAGIRVIMDVVYNHCHDVQQSNFHRTYPDYYFRKKGKKLSNGSGCGNETASERPLMRQFIVESVLYWVREYHVDGFRFDLMGLHDVTTMNLIRFELDRIDPSLTLYGEGWTAGPSALSADKRAHKSSVRRMPRIGAFGDEMRDALRGPFGDDRKSAFLAAQPGHEESLKFGLVGGIRHPDINMSRVNYSSQSWALQPFQHVSYVSCHDDMGLVDRLRTSCLGIKDEELVRLDKLAQTFVLTSQGVPFLWAGEEVLRDKKGMCNTYNQPDAVNQIDWTPTSHRMDVFHYYRALIDIRRSHRAFRMGDANLVRKYMHFFEAPSCVVAFGLDGKSVGDAWNYIVCIMNANASSQSVTIPSGTYTVVCRDGLACAEGLDRVEGGTIAVGPQQSLIVWK